MANDLVFRKELGGKYVSIYKNYKFISGDILYDYSFVINNFDSKISGYNFIDKFSAIRSAISHITKSEKDIEYMVREVKLDILLDDFVGHEQPNPWDLERLI